MLPASPAEAAGKRNIVLIVADDHGPDAGCYGNKDVRTPNVDRLAVEGTRFDFAFCTTASCSASRSVVLSGLHNHLNGQYGHQHHFHHFSSFPSVKSLPVLLAGAGYRTAQIGKYHVAPEPIYHFETYLKGNQGGDRNRADASKSAPIVRGSLISSRPRSYDSPGTDPFTEEKHDHRSSGYQSLLPQTQGSPPPTRPVPSLP